jgi:hypothetical protein
MNRSDRTARTTVALVLGLGIAATTGGVLADIGRWGNYDWDYFFFQAFSNHRCLFEFGQLPLWNPWYVGGVPAVANFQSLFPSPWLLLDAVAGPVAAIKLGIVLQHAVGLAAMYWMARVLRMSRLAAVYVAGTFFFSSWVALRIHSGHLTYLSTAYLPLLVGLFVRARNEPKVAFAIGSGAVVALMIFQGGIYDVILAAFVLAPLALGWCVQDRSIRPVLFAVTVGLWAAGFSAAKLFPVANYMREHPRITNSDGTEGRHGPSAGTPAASVESASNAGAPIDKVELPKFVLRVFLGHEQRSNCVYSPLQRFGWHEYGAYVGPLAILLALASRWWAFDRSWPWLLIAAVCLVVSAGAFAPVAPWSLLHKLPVFDNMHCPSRWLIPSVFALTVAAGFCLDAVRDKLAGSRPGRVDLVLGLLVAAALVDSVLVFRHSIAGAFPNEPPPARPIRPDVVTIVGERLNMTEPMLANECTGAGYEPITPKTRVEPCASPDYHGEAYFRPDAAEAPVGKVETVEWTPNAVTVRAACDAAGSVVLNRNWNKGWRADPPYATTPLDGLISARVGPGEHEIRFVFVPTDFRTGCYVSLATATLAGAVWLRQRRTGRVAI